MNSSIVKTRDATMTNIHVLDIFSKEIFISYLPTRIKRKTAFHDIKLCFKIILLFKMWPVISIFFAAKHGNILISQSRIAFLKFSWQTELLEVSLRTREMFIFFFFFKQSYKVNSKLHCGKQQTTTTKKNKRQHTHKIT